MSDASYLIIDLETGPNPDEELREMYREPTFEEFAAKRNKSWGDAAKQKHFEIAIASGWQEFVEKAALSPITGHVLAVGLATELDGKLQPRIITGPEASILDATWQAIRQAIEIGMPIIGHNIEGFDFPFLTRRSWKHGVDCPIVFRGRYLVDGFVDTQSEWCKGTTDRFVNLDVVASFFGVGGKLVMSRLIEWEGVNRPLTGEHFWRYFRDTEMNRKLAIDYLVNDLAMTARVAKRMQLV